jgi:hypothetical protein
MKNWREEGRMIRKKKNKLAEKPPLVSSQQ